MNADFSPAWFLTNPHLGTIWGQLAHPRTLVSLHRQWLETPDGDGLVLGHLDQSVVGDRRPAGENNPSATAAPGPADLRFVLMHGLLSPIERHGYSATAMNVRSCARDPQNRGRMLPNRRPRFDHSGETDDFDFVVRWLIAKAGSP